MNANTDHKEGKSSDDLKNGRSQVIFIAVGVLIILGGLWLLYSADGPYHPGGETQVNLSDES